MVRGFVWEKVAGGQALPQTSTLAVLLISSCSFHFISGTHKWQILNLRVDRKDFWGFNGIQTHDQCNALPTELWSLFGSRSRVSSIYTCYMKRVRWCAYDISHIYELWIKNRSESQILTVMKQLKQLQRKLRWEKILRLQQDSWNYEIKFSIYKNI